MPGNTSKNRTRTPVEYGLVAMDDLGVLPTGLQCWQSYASKKGVVTKAIDSRRLVGG